MKTSRVITAVFLALSGTVLSQTLPSTLPSKSRPGYAGALATARAWLFHIVGKHYRAIMTHDQMQAGPDWTPSMPLPLSFGKAEEIARAELKKLVPDAVSWEVTDLELKRDEDQRKWYYVIGLKPGASSAKPNPDYFFAVMNLSGEVGTIEPDPNPSHR
jgi:hypothetical protein